MLIPCNVKIFFYAPPIDMRKSIDTLCVLIEETVKMNPAEGHLFLFRNRSGNKLKALHYETNCFTLWYRRLERGKFIFQKNSHENIEMTQEHFQWLLASDKYSRREAAESRYYKHFH